MCQAFGNLPEQLVVRKVPDTLRSLEKSMDKSAADLDILLSNSSVSDLGKLVLEWSVKAHDSLDEFRCFDSFVQTLAVQ